MVEDVGRVFVAVVPPPEVKMALADAVAPLDLPGRPVPMANWHVTVRFLGRVDSLTYERFLGGIGLEGHSPAKVGLGGVGAFPSQGKAHVVYAEITTGAGWLAALNGVAEEAAQGAGLAPEERPYRPHLTLARVRPPVPLGPAAGHPIDLGWRCGELQVMRSQPGRGGARYETLDILALAR